MEKLAKMLDDANIPYEMHRTLLGSPQICYYGKDGKHEQTKGVYYGSGYGTVCDVIYGYGREQGLLEISGLLTEEEKVHNTVLGGLSAENIFQRIKSDWESE